ncbi:uncharacterized protein FA14DRAFT_87862 [Meira miltonrushii]|uniref:Uncharacterized protein n=1 Tax=Meira miltonrushii TaxID=1280837 RepID=A0A316V4C6_9BASI|nr:uncharacterized protein FA14DRAFT_87862 [Meira miltonrushii]PWN32396.1 hypothetical protein FA14DRAFT_87862 [Meira miltonrushii]
MEFSQDESEEVSKLKKQLVEERMHSSQLQHTQVKLIEENKNLKDNLKHFQSSFDENAAKLDRAERNQESIRDERDRFKLNSDNLEQALSKAKNQLSQKNKFDRLEDDVRVDVMSRPEKELIQEIDQLKEKCKALEIRLNDVQVMADAGPSSIGSDAKYASAKLLSLENENTTLKADNQRLRQGSTMIISDSNPSNFASEEQHSRELITKLNQQIAAAKERSLRFEREALIASNERLASEKRTKHVIQSLETARDDLKDEVKLREAHINELEKQLQGIHTLLDKEIDSPFNEIEGRIRNLIQDGKDVTSIRTILMKWRSDDIRVANKAELPKSVSDLAAQIVKAYLELDIAYQTMKKAAETNSLLVEDLQKELQKSSQASKALKKREKEMVKAKGRLKMLSGSLQKALPLAAGLQSVVGDASISGAGGVSFSAIGDETIAGGNESTLGGLRGFEADLVDEMEQLITYVEDLDNRLEFQRVEQEIREMSAISERDRLKNELSVLEREYLEVKTSLQDANHGHQVEVHQLQEEKRIAIEQAEDAYSVAKQQEESCTQMEKKLAHHELLANQDIENLLQLLDRYQQVLQDEGLRWQTMSKVQSIDMTQFAADLIKRSADWDSSQRAVIDMEREKARQLEATLSDQQERYEVEKQRHETKSQALIISMKEELEYCRAQIEERAQKEEEQAKIVAQNALLLAELREEIAKERTKAESLQRDWTAFEAQLLEDNAVKDRKLEEAQTEINTLTNRENDTSSTAKEKEMTEALSIAQSTIEHLEHELAIKAQECEDADDKEIALRKDNKRLLSRIATMQARLEKLQQPQFQQNKALDTVPSSVPPSSSSGSLKQSHPTKLSKDQPVTRKRRNSDMEEKQVNGEKTLSGNTEELPSSKVDRAYVYAPGPTSMTLNASQRNARDRFSPAFSAGQHHNHAIGKNAGATPIDEISFKQKGIPSEDSTINPPSSAAGSDALNRSQGRSGGSSKPSDLVALRLQQKIASQPSTTSVLNTSTQSLNPARIKDRTNKPRENVNVKANFNSSQKDTIQIQKASNDNDFMTKLNRYRTPSNGFSGTTSTTMQDHSRPPLRG